jgi:hypothetical protein
MGHRSQFKHRKAIFFTIVFVFYGMSNRTFSLLPPYTVKNVSDFSVPSRDVTNRTLPGLE